MTKLILDQETADEVMELLSSQPIACRIKIINRFPQIPYSELIVKGINHFRKMNNHLLVRFGGEFRTGTLTADCSGVDFCDDLTGVSTRYSNDEFVARRIESVALILKADGKAPSEESPFLPL